MIKPPKNSFPSPNQEDNNAVTLRKILKGKEKLYQFYNAIFYFFYRAFLIKDYFECKIRYSENKKLEEKTHKK